MKNREFDSNTGGERLPALESGREQRLRERKRRLAEARDAIGGAETGQNPPKRGSRRKKRGSVLKFYFWIFMAMLVCSSTAVGIAVGYLNSYLDQMPSIPFLEDYRPSMPSQIFSAGPRRALVADFFRDRQNRELVPLNVMPDYLINAVIALEDIRFYEHCGISPRAFIRAAIHDIRTGTLEQGGSTITMQLAEDLIKGGHLEIQLPEMTLKSFRQKIWEVILALQIEKRYTKEKILEIYLNQVFMGGNIYGVARAAESYFGKEVSELNLKECALFAGMLQRPNAYSPTRNLEAAESRTRVVLGEMLEHGFITQEEYDQAAGELFQLNTTATRRAQIQMHPYFTEEIRRRFESGEIEDAKGNPIEIYGQGVDIESTLDLDLQAIAEEAMKRGIRDHEHRRRPMGGKFWGAPGYGRANGDGPRTLTAGHEYDARITGEYDPQSSTIQVSVPNVNGGKGPFTVPVVPDGTWLDEFDLLHPGIFIRVNAVERGGSVALELADDEYVQGALVAVRPSTGQVLALVGGYDFNESSFIRATQALTVQPGSAFKPFLFAAAICDDKKDWTPTTNLLDVERDYFRGWTPRNFYNRYYGWVSMRYSLVHSLNAASVWLLDNLRPGRMQSIQHFRDFCRRTFELEIDKSNLTIALGTSGTTPYDLAQAYAVLANRGEFMGLHMVERVYQRQDSRHMFQKQLYEFQQPFETRKRMTAEEAYLISYMLNKVVDEGTAEEAKALPFFTAGKTGTTDDCTYAWFAGYSRDILCVVYVGYDDFQRSLGYKMTGSKVALPIWMDFMEKAHEARPELFGDMPVPEGIVLKNVCVRSGRPAGSSCPSTERIPYDRERAPGGICPVHGGEQLDPYRNEANKALTAGSL